MFAVGVQILYMFHRSRDCRETSELVATAEAIARSLEIPGSSERRLGGPWGQRPPVARVLRSRPGSRVGVTQELGVRVTRVEGRPSLARVRRRVKVAAHGRAASFSVCRSAWASCLSPIHRAVRSARLRAGDPAPVGTGPPSVLGRRAGSRALRVYSCVAVRGSGEAVSLWRMLWLARVQSQSESSCLGNRT